MRKFLIGCAIVAGALFLVSVGTGIVLFSWVKREMPDLQQVEDVRRELVERFGTREEFEPDLEAEIRSERIDLVLAVRESLLATRAEIAVRTESFLERTREENWQDRGAFQKILEGLSMARGGLGLFSQGMEYIGERAVHLLDVEMGEGEYTWYYALMTFCWLEWDVRDEIGIEWFEDHDMADVPEQLRDEYRRIVMRQLRNKRRALEKIEERTAADDRVLELVDAVLDEARADPDLFPFQGRLPQEWIDALEPHRARFVATLPRTPGEYLLDSVEQLIEEDEQGIHIQFD
ncbi:MAG: hypothetical protein JSW67_02605 [Candidatus Latescibacterota bacterium]|nr:MAG: hypothetical protein JSW67_02605 [Candidatus Latescibacterota bacterium]